MLKIFIIFCILLLLIVTQYDEIVKSRQNCYIQRKKDISLLSRDVCVDKIDRKEFEGMVNCKQAEERTQVPLWMYIPFCTVKTWISNTDIVNIYKKLTDSYWSILGVILPITFMVIYFWQKERHHQEDRRKYLRLREK